jgi:RNA polymerase sigma-70 factor (ECF subfamily)
LSWNDKAGLKRSAPVAVSRLEKPARAVRNAPGEGDEPLRPGDESPASAPDVPEFEAVYAQTFEMVWRSLRMLGVDSALLDDAVQDVFGAVARQLPGFASKSSLRTWVFGIAENVANNHRRTRLRKLDRLEALPDVVASAEPTPHAYAEGREAAEVVLKFCASLDESRRTLFVLGVLEGVPASDIATALRISVNSVYTRIHVLRQELRQRLERHESEV